MEMSKKEILRLFRKFLIRNDALEDFVKTNKKERCYKVDNPKQFIIGSFDWGNHTTKWSLLNELWIEELKHKGIEC